VGGQQHHLGKKEETPGLTILLLGRLLRIVARSEIFFILLNQKITRVD
jgi:hypothetical protein